MGTATDACTPFTSDSDGSSSTLIQPQFTSPSSTTSFEGTCGDGLRRILAAAEMLTRDQDCRSTSHGDGADQPPTIVGFSPCNEITGTSQTAGNMNQQWLEGLPVGPYSSGLGSMLGGHELTPHPGRHRTRDELYESQPPRKRPRREDCSSATDGARVEVEFNGDHPMLEAELAGTARTHDPSIVRDNCISSQPYASHVDTIPQQDTVQSINWNYPVTLTTPDPSFGAAAGDVGILQPWPSDQLQELQDSSSDMSIWLNNDLDFMGF